MKHYTHLTQEQRYQISVLKKSAYSYSEIANIVGCHKSTISREIKRNTGKRGYRPLQAQEMAEDRKKQNVYQHSDFAKAYINHLIERKYSPEQMTGRLKRLG